MYSSIGSSNPPRAGQIRLPKVDLTDSSSELRLTIAHWNTSSLPAYQAISYTWGEQPHKYRTISLNSQSLQITQNAFWCLHFICKHYRRWEYLWIDAVCIDQSNVLERNEQVQRMDQIYPKARLVLAWLGSDHDINDHVWSAKDIERNASKKS